MRLRLGWWSPGYRHALVSVLVAGLAVAVWFAVQPTATVVVLAVGAGGVLQQQNRLPSRRFYVVGLTTLTIGAFVVASAENHGLRLIGMLMATAGTMVAVVTGLTRLQHNPEAFTVSEVEQVHATEIHDA